MEKFIISLIVAGGIFILIPVFAVLSGLGAWITGLFFGNMIAETFMSLFNTTIDLREIGFFHIGVTLGFLGGFIKSTQTNSNNKS